MLKILDLNVILKNLPLRVLKNFNLRLVVSQLILILITYIVSEAKAAEIDNQKNACSLEATAAKEPLGYISARKAISRLPEFTRVQRRIGSQNSIAFQNLFSKQVIGADGECYWKVSVAIDWRAPGEQARLSAWHDFLVDRRGKVKFVTDPVEGNFITLRQWRNSEFHE